MLSYYWNVERPAYITQVEGDQLNAWEVLWQRLGDLIEHEHAVTSHR
jgi:hypothetical protein